MTELIKASESVSGTGGMSLGLNVVSGLQQPGIVLVTVAQNASVGAAIPASYVPAAASKIIVFGSGNASATTQRTSSRTRHVPRSISDLDMIGWITGRGIRNKELHVAFSDED